MNPRRRQWLTALATAGASWCNGARAQGGAPARTQPPTQLQPQAHPQPQAQPHTQAGAARPAADLAPAPPPADTGIRRGRLLVFPRDHGAHLSARTEWWYATGWLADARQPQQPTHGFQLTFFRSRTGLAAGNGSRFAARQLLFAHAAVTDLRGRRHLHDQRIVRWSGAADAALGSAAAVGGDVRIHEWQLRDDGRGWQASVGGGQKENQADGRFQLALQLQRSQPLLLQGDAGFSRKGPDERQASHYYSEPQLAASGNATLAGATADVVGRGWLDHEWSDEILHAEAVGWDWIGINLSDGGALTAFVLRRSDGSTLWGGGSFRAAPGQPVQSFAAEAVHWQPGRRWRSPASAASYPVEWTIATPAGSFTVRALMDAQELDSRASTGTIYWEGLSELLDAQGKRIGLGYLEMTGYAAGLRL